MLFYLCPHSAHGVYRFSLHFDAEVDEIAVFLDDGSETVCLEILLLYLYDACLFICMWIKTHVREWKHERDRATRGRGEGDG
jgi:hypothetical protein